MSMKRSKITKGCLLLTCCKYIEMTSVKSVTVETTVFTFHVLEVSCFGRFCTIV